MLVGECVRTRSSLVPAIVFGLCLMAPRLLLGQDFTGFTSVDNAPISFNPAIATGTWTDPANWLCGDCPGPAYPNNGVLDSTYVPDISGPSAVSLSGVPVVVNNLFINHPAASLSLASSMIVGPSASSLLLTNQGAIVLQDGASLTLDLSPMSSGMNSGRIQIGTGADLYLNGAYPYGPSTLSLTGQGSIDLHQGRLTGITGREILMTDNLIQGSGTIANLGLQLSGGLNVHGDTLTLRPSASGATLQGPALVSGTASSPGRLVLDSSLGGAIASDTFSSGTIRTARGILEIVTNDAVVGGPSFTNGKQIFIGDGDQMLVRAPAGGQTTIRNDISIVLQGTNQGSTLTLSGDRATFAFQGDGQFIATPQSVIRGEVGTETFVNQQVLQLGIYDIFDPATLGLQVSHLAQFVNDRYLPAFAPHGVTIDPTVGRFVNNNLIEVFGTLTAPGMQNNRQLTVFAGGIADLRSGVWENLSGGTLTGGTYDLSGTLLYSGSNITNITAGTTLLLSPGGLLSRDGSSSALSSLAHNAGFLILVAEQFVVTPSGGTLVNANRMVAPSLVVNGNLTNQASGQLSIYAATASITDVFENLGTAVGQQLTAASISNSGTLLGALTAASISNSGTMTGPALTTDTLVNSGSLFAGTVQGGVLHNSGSLSVDAFQFSGPMVNTGSFVLRTHGHLIDCDFLPCFLPPPNGTSSTGTSLTNSGFLDLGPAVTNPFLAVSENTVHLNSLVNTRTGVLNMQAITHLTVSGEVTNDGAFILGSATVPLNVVSNRLDIGGRLVNNGDIALHPTALLYPSIVLTAGAFTNTGQLLVQGITQDSFTTFHGGRMHVYGDVLNLGSIDVRGGSSLLAIPVPLEYDGRLSVDGAFVNVGALSIGGNPPSFYFGWEGGRVTVNDDFLNSGLVDIRSSCCGRSYVPQPATLQVASGHSYIQTAGHTEVNGVLQADRLGLQGGTLGGGGTIIGDLLNLGGVVAPDGPTTLHITGNYIQGPLGTLQLLFTSRTDYDALALTGDVHLDGLLRILFDNSYTPTLGDTFTILSFGGTLSGDFAHFAFPEWGGFMFAERIDAYTLTLEVVPIPEGVPTPEPALLLPLTGLILLCLWRRRQRRL